MYKLLADGSGGTANPVTPPAAPDSPTGIDVPIEGDRSDSEIDLINKIDEELGLPKQPVNEETTEDEENTDEEVDTPDGDTGENDTETDESATEESEEAVDEEEADDEETEEEETKEATPDEDLEDESAIEIEDANGQTFKISSIDDLPEDFEPKNNRQIIEIVAAITRLDEQNRLAAEDKKLAEVAAEEQRVQNEQFASWNDEIKALEAEKRFDTKDDKRIDAVFSEMVKINNARAKAGNTNYITSFEDALEKLEAREAREATVSNEKKATEKAKLKSSLIGRSSSTSKESPVYVAGSYRNMDDIPL
jgi:hypothetical protein